jgi:CRP-like cAMP-binding protein
VRAAAASLSPRCNRLLAALPPRDLRRLARHLQPVELRTGACLHAAGRPEPFVYFPTDGVVSRSCTTRGGQCLGFALTEREGAIGVGAFLSGAGMPTEAVVMSPGHAYRVPADALAREFARGGPIAQVLMRYTGDLLTQAGRIAACSRFHTLERRLCRLLLACLDRSRSGEVVATHQMLAEMLGVRREGVTAALKKLRRAKLVRGDWGRVVVLDRAGLEAGACECYASSKRDFRALPCQAR